MIPYRIYTLAQRIARKSTHYQHRVSCVVYRGKEVIAVGFNQLKTHTQSPDPWHTVHAEFASLWGLSKDDLKKAKIFVYRETVTGHIGLARPCEHCERMIRSLGIRKVYYSVDRDTVAMVDYLKVSQDKRDTSPYLKVGAS